MSLTIAIVCLAIIWLVPLVFWIGSRGRSPRARVRPSPEQIRRYQDNLLRGLLAILSIIFLSTSLRHAFALPERVDPTQGWLYVIVWSLMVSTYGNLGLIRRYLERARSRDVNF